MIELEEGFLSFEKEEEEEAIGLLMTTAASTGTVFLFLLEVDFGDCSPSLSLSRREGWSLDDSFLSFLDLPLGLPRCFVDDMAWPADLPGLVHQLRHRFPDRKAWRVGPCRRGWPPHSAELKQSDFRGSAFWHSSG